jgi:hypothetical protein
MQTLSFERLARELEAVGAAPSVIARITQELEDHCADAEHAALERGVAPAEARQEAYEAIGSPDAIAAAVAAQPHLLDWRHRWPQSARCVDSLTWCAALPAAPFVYCASHPAFIVRWGLSSSLALCVTGSILLAMQWLVVMGNGL